MPSVIPARLRPELNRLEDNASSCEDEVKELREKIFHLRNQVDAKIPKKKGCRKLKLQQVHRSGKVPKCKGCGKPIDRGDPDFDQSWHIVTGSKHYHHYCIESFTREERWKLFEIVRDLVKRKEMDELTFDSFNEAMKLTEEFPSFMEQAPEHSYQIV